MVASADTVIFVCDSKDSLFADKALVGTTGYKVFLEYLDVLHLSVNDVLLYTDKDFRTVEAIAKEDAGVRVITLGTEAEDCIKEANIPFRTLPLQISGIGNLDLDLKLKEAGDFINDYQDC